MGGLLFLGLLLLLALVAEQIAANKGRSGCGFQVFAVLMPPLALIVAVLMPPDPDVADERAIRRGEKVRCPACQSAIHVDAVVCPHCQSRIAKGLDARGREIRIANIPS